MVESSSKNCYHKSPKQWRPLNFWFNFSFCFETMMNHLYHVLYTCQYQVLGSYPPTSRLSNKRRKLALRMDSVQFHWQCKTKSAGNARGLHTSPRSPKEASRPIPDAVGSEIDAINSGEAPAPRRGRLCNRSAGLPLLETVLLVPPFPIRWRNTLSPQDFCVLDKQQCRKQAQNLPMERYLKTKVARCLMIFPREHWVLVLLNSAPNLEKKKMSYFHRMRFAAVRLLRWDRGLHMVYLHLDSTEFSYFSIYFVVRGGIDVFPVDGNFLKRVENRSKTMSEE
ncbi:hypothetical protein C8R44DRAFT_742243 [Mycena epipterygia]|nr:hypothetical protein C8R44DRAFT_742243 [Mycena epipterygia]